MMQLSNQKMGRGFTLVELMVSVALASIMMGLVSSVFFTAGRLTREADGKVEIHTEARFILDKIAAILQAISLRNIEILIYGSFLPKALAISEKTLR